MASSPSPFGAEPSTSASSSIPFPASNTGSNTPLSSLAKLTLRSHLPRSSTHSTRSSISISRQGEPLTTVGHRSVGSYMPLDLLRSVYFVPDHDPRLVADFPNADEEDGWDLDGEANGEGEEDVEDGGRTAHPESEEKTKELIRKLMRNESTRTIKQQAQPPVAPEGPALHYRPFSTYPPVRLLARAQRKRVLVTGGAGFVGSHLVDRLMFSGHEVTVLDNFFTGSRLSISHWIGHPNFELVRHDIVDPFMLECDQIYHLACPASPRAYQYNAVKTIKTNFLGTMNMLGLAKRVKARVLLASTSEVYGSPDVHPQPESYWGNVNPIGPRACYDEGKRVAEALTYGYHRQDNVDVRVSRIFNAFGPRLATGDGRFVSNFVVQAIKGEDVTVYGDGLQTRSLQFVHDLVDGLILLMESDFPEPVNLGNESDESSILTWATLIIDVVEDVISEPQWASIKAQRPKKSDIVHLPALQDDPPRRRPDITRAKKELGWEPRFTVRAGIEETVRYFLGKMREATL